MGTAGDASHEAAGERSKDVRTVFVIMPLAKTESRDKSQLTSFFKSAIKNPIESTRDLKYKYVVKRSEKSFDITASIIRDVVSADIVIADLSGVNGNPNVLYELGVRLSTSHRPTFLIREENPNNAKIFDVQGFYCEPYDILSIDRITSHLIERIRAVESGDEIVRSPVLEIIRGSADILLSDEQVVREAHHLFKMGQELFSLHSRLFRRSVDSLVKKFGKERVPDDVVELYGDEELNTAALELTWDFGAHPVQDLPQLRLFYLQDMLGSVAAKCRAVQVLVVFFNAFYMDFCLFRTGEKIKTVADAIKISGDIVCVRRNLLGCRWRAAQ